MDKGYVRARVEEILEGYDTALFDADVKNELIEALVSEFTKIEMEDLFDIDAATEELDDLDAG